jgi:hypothetical protein
MWRDAQRWLVGGRRTTIRSVARELRSDEMEQADNLLIEAVSLLVQRHRETESWLSEQIAQADHRAAATERRYADLETRLTGIEDQLDRLARELEPRFDTASDERLARLREQVEDLKSEGDGRSVRVVPSHGPVIPASSPMAAVPPPAVLPPPTPIAPPVGAAPAHSVPSAPASAVVTAPSPAPAAPVVAVSSGQAESVWDVLGPRPQDRFGLVLIGLGLLAVFFAILTQLHFG